MSMMAKVYADLIRKGKKTVKTFPKVCRRKSRRCWRVTQNDPAGSPALFHTGKGGG